MSSNAEFSRNLAVWLWTFHWPNCVNLPLSRKAAAFSRAAEILHISQPALSRSIAATEKRCGFPIFNRIGHGVEPTAAGAQLIAQAEPLLLSMRVFDSNVGLLAQGKAGSLKIGLPPLLASQLLPRLAPHFFMPGSKIELRVSIRPAANLLDELKSGSIEFFLLSEDQTETGPEIELAAIGSMQPVCVVRGGHPLAGRNALNIADLGNFPWGSSVEPPAMGNMLNPARFLCDNFHVLREVVLHTDLVCICTRAFAAADIERGDLCELDIPEFLPDVSSVYLASLQGRISSPLAMEASRRLRTLLAEACLQ